MFTCKVLCKPTAQTQSEVRRLRSRRIKRAKVGIIRKAEHFCTAARFHTRLDLVCVCVCVCVRACVRVCQCMSVRACVRVLKAYLQATRQLHQSVLQKLHGLPQTVLQPKLFQITTHSRHKQLPSIPSQTFVAILRGLSVQ